MLAPSINISTQEEGGGPIRQKRGRGWPPVPMGRSITLKVMRTRMTIGDKSDHVYTDGNLTYADISDLRYRWMRDLNNEAWKRCHQNRKKEEDLLNEEFETERKRNIELRSRLTLMENKVRSMKSSYIQLFASGGQISNMPDTSELWSTMDKNDF